jgi:hypothetical protein
MSPPWARATPRAIARPSPVPSARVVKKGSKRRSCSSGAMPRPLSRTVKRTAGAPMPASAAATSTASQRSVPPASQAWMPFSSRLVSAPPSALRSPTSSASPQAQSAVNTTWRARATGSSVCASSASSSHTAKRWRPALSPRANSSMSRIRRSR